MKVEDIKLGIRVRDLMSNLEGMVSHRVDFLNGMIQFGIQPKGEGDKVPDAWLVDAPQLEYLDEGISHLAGTPESCDIPLGARVRDKVSGFLGTTVEKYTTFNGCVNFQVLGFAEKGRLLASPDSLRLDINRIEVQAEKDPIPTAPPGRKQGGPTTRVPARRSTAR